MSNKKWKAICPQSEVFSDGMPIVPAIKSFSNGEREYHIVRCDGEFYLVDDEGAVADHWPAEIIKSIGAWLRTRCFSCEVNPQKYVTGLCEECHQVAMNADKLLNERAK